MNEDQKMKSPKNKNKKSKCFKSIVKNTRDQGDTLPNGVNVELTVFFLNVNKNIIGKLNNIDEFISKSADLIFIFEPNLGNNVVFPEERFPDYTVNVLDRLYLLVLVRNATNLVVDRVNSWTPAAIVSGRQVSIIGLYNRQSNNEGDPLKPQERFLNVKEVIDKGLAGARKKSIFGGDVNLDLGQTVTKKHANGLDQLLKNRGFEVGKFKFTRKGGKGQSNTNPDWLAYRGFPGGTTSSIHIEDSDHNLLYFANSREFEFNKRTTNTVDTWKFGSDAERYATVNSPRMNFIDNFNDLKLDETIDKLNEYLNGLNEVCKKKIVISNFGVPWYTPELMQLRHQIHTCEVRKHKKALRSLYRTKMNAARKKFNHGKLVKKGHPWPSYPSSAAKSYTITDQDGNTREVSDDAEMAEEQGLEWRTSIDKLCGGGAEPDTTGPIIARFRKKFIQLKKKLQADDPLQKEWSFRIPTEKDVATLIRKSKPKASSSFDEISHRLVKKVEWHITPLLTKMMKLIVENSVFPEALKMIKLVAVHKKGKPKNLCSSYRPIAIQSTLAKFVDMWIVAELTRITDHLAIMPENIHGYRKYFSCATALRQLFSAIDEARAKKMNLAILGVDYSKAYDTIALKLCPEIMGALGASGATVALLKKFLCERPCRVVHKGKKSKKYHTKRGILQGAASSPKLFSVITTDKEEILKPHCSGLILYADDSLIYWFYEKTEDAAEKTKKKILKVAKLIEDWGAEAQLRLNKQKTELLVISNCKRKDCAGKCAIKSVNILGTEVKASKTLKFLGVTIDDRGSLDPYVEILRNQMDTANGILKSIQGGCSKDAKRQLFYGLIVSRIMTSAKAYLPRLGKTNTGKLNDKLQACLRTISNVPLFGPENFDGTRYSAKANMKEWGIPSVQDLQVEIENINTLENFDAAIFEDDCKNISGDGLPRISDYHMNSYRRKEFLLAKDSPQTNIACFSVKNKNVNSVTPNNIKSYFHGLREKNYASRRETKRIKRVIKNTIRKFQKEKRSNEECIEQLFNEFGDSVNFYLCRNTNGISYIFKIDDYDD